MIHIVILNIWIYIYLSICLVFFYLYFETFFKINLHLPRIFLNEKFTTRGGTDQFAGQYYILQE